MKEYEYSFKVDDLEPYINYCENNNYELISINSETRDLYTSNNKVLARLTINDKEIIIDFKEENDTDKVLKERKESLPLSVDKKDLDKIYSILDMLGYKLYKQLVRTRRVYKKNNIKFELDDYIFPEIMHVVAIEGAKREVDKLYKEIKNY